MSKQFTKEELFIIGQDYYLVDEVVVDIRKGIPQTRYVIEVGCYDKQVWSLEKDCLIDFPDYLKGLWMQDWATDNTYDGVSSRLKDEDECWVKCKQVEVTTYEYQEIE